MTPEIQTIAALAIVAVAAALLLRGTWKKRKSPGCGGDCGAVSKDARKLRARSGL